MLYFAYGSNMSATRLRRRVPSAEAFSAARLAGHRLVFHKVGRDGSAKCDVLATQVENDVVYGVVYRIDPAHKPRLDAAEGLGKGYAEKTVQVECTDGGNATVFLYYATHIDPDLRPYTWYKAHVLRGAREHGLPSRYIALIEGIETVEDSDRVRHAMETAIYR